MDNIYLKSILKSMDESQMDYYKECTLADILLCEKHGNLPVLIIFGKTAEELFEYESNDVFAYRTLLHYPFCLTLKYEKGIKREDLIILLQNAISKAYDMREKRR